MENLVKSAVEGDKTALETVVKEIQDLIYNLAVRMLWHPDEAKDATQEILIKVITNLSSFQHQSSFKTWVYRLASNTLINYNQQIHRKKLSFNEYSTYLNQGFSNQINYTTNPAERNLLVIEAKVGCSNAMLQCLNDDHRMVYIIGEILELNSREGAIILDITAANFRKKLSRAREKLHAFIHNNCGIVNPANPCRCHKKVDDAIKNKFIHPENLLFIKKEATEALIASIETIQTEVNLYRSNPTYNTPANLLHEIKKIMTSVK